MDASAEADAGAVAVSVEPVPVVSLEAVVFPDPFVPAVSAFEVLSVFPVCSFAAFSADDPSDAGSPAAGVSAAAVTTWSVETADPSFASDPFSDVDPSSAFGSAESFLGVLTDF
ncbi:MAG: hypothetical protein Q4D81_04250 [Eubacteriales bacterium]|nr:hypothetical protein [Eubacteriales bacterium]